MRFRYAALALPVLLALAACGDATSSSSSGSGGGGSNATAGAVNESLGYTLQTANISGLGTVLVNGNGKTLYILTSEKGGTVTCTDSNGCTAVWPTTELPSGVTAAIAGSGIQSSQLGTAMGAGGATFATYGGYPVHTYTGDTGSGTAMGQGIQSFGGTWYVIGADGNPITTANGGAGGNGY